MLLILSNSKDVTTDYLEGLVKQNGIETVRFDTDLSLTHAAYRYGVGLPELRLGDRWYAPDEFSSVWYRRPEHLKDARHDDTPEGKFILKEWAEALEAFFAHIPSNRWINHPSVNVAASHKLEQLTTARRFGFHVPQTVVTQDPDCLRRFFKDQNGRIIVKPLSMGYVERNNGDQDSLIYTNQVIDDHLKDLFDLPSCPTLFQDYIHKASDIRITVVDRNIHAVELIAQEPDGSQRCDVRRNNMSDVAYRNVILPQDIADMILALTFHYKLRYAAIDMAITATGEWIFFEVNPNGQWAWLDLAGATKIADSFLHAFNLP